QELAQQEVAQLRQKLQTQQEQRSQGAGSPPQAAPRDEPAPRRTGLWWGLLAGLALGGIGAGGALWMLPASTESAAVTAAVVPATRPAAVAPPPAVIKPASPT